MLEKWGTLRFEDVAARAIQYARDGFPLRPRTVATIERQRKFFESWPDNARTWLKSDGTFYKAGETIRLPDLAATLTKMVEAERGAKRRGRAAAVAAARDRFYKGDIGREIVAFLKGHGAPFDESDFAEFFARIEEPASITYRGIHGLQTGLQQPGSGAAAVAQHPRELRSQESRAQQRGLPSRPHRGDEAGVRGSGQLLRGSDVS